jgi:hypothetical protein
LNGAWNEGGGPAPVSEDSTTRRLLDYQVREKLEPREADSSGFWRPASRVVPLSRDIDSHRSNTATEKQSQVKAFLSTLLGSGETSGDPIVIDDAGEA